MPGCCTIHRTSVYPHSCTPHLQETTRKRVLRHHNMARKCRFPSRNSNHFRRKQNFLKLKANVARKIQGYRLESLIRHIELRKLKKKKKLCRESMNCFLDLWISWERFENIPINSVSIILGIFREIIARFVPWNYEFVKKRLFRVLRIKSSCTFIDN